MKKILKGFTLIELIIVMALITIIMAGVIRLYEPVNSVYTSTSVMSAQRIAEQGIADYITENCRYATSIGIYQDQSSADAAMNLFLAKNPTFATKWTINGSGDIVFTPVTKNDLEVICIQNTTGYSMSGSTLTYTGRLIRKITGQSGFSETQSDFLYDGSGKSFMALGDAYYGAADYYIRIRNAKATGFDVIIDSDYYTSTAGKDSTRLFNRGDTTSSSDWTNYTMQSVALNNTTTVIQGYKHVTDFDHVDDTVGTRSNMKKNTYIVYVNG